MFAARAASSGRGSEPRHAKPAITMVSGSHTAVALDWGFLCGAILAPQRQVIPAGHFGATTGYTQPVLEVTGCQLEATWAARAFPHKYMKRSSEPDRFIYLSGGSGILLRWRLGLQWGASPYVLPPSRSPLWPSVNRTDHPEECHSMLHPPQHSSEQKTAPQSSERQSRRNTSFKDGGTSSE